MSFFSKNQGYPIFIPRFNLSVRTLRYHRNSDIACAGQFYLFSTTKGSEHVSTNTGKLHRPVRPDPDVIIIRTLCAISRESFGAWMPKYYGIAGVARLRADLEKSVIRRSYLPLQPSYGSGRASQFSSHQRNVQDRRTLAEFPARSL